MPASTEVRVYRAMTGELLLPWQGWSSKACAVAADGCQWAPALGQAYQSAAKRPLLCLFGESNEMGGTPRGGPVGDSPRTSSCEQMSAYLIKDEDWALLVGGSLFLIFLLLGRVHRLLTGTCSTSLSPVNSISLEANSNAGQVENPTSAQYPLSLSFLLSDSHLSTTHLSSITMLG
ncbi:unnamed protein product [Pleuronectes platessa]|uniref:Uncharacterized protein n=1 Tax=Pleuronectes platessa TaxID=8262 RepID=A0A9N7U8I6_PLEPL|nr:unnamed protein product [Pleuronectes platessa]